MLLVQFCEFVTFWGWFFVTNPTIGPIKVGHGGKKKPG